MPNETHVTTRKNTEPSGVTGEDGGKREVEVGHMEKVSTTPYCIGEEKPQGMRNKVNM